jgi:mannose-1-phosphate guanylyltransferase
LLPKQYVNFIGRRSMLEHTFDRAEKLTTKQFVFTIINKPHLAFLDVRRQLAERNPGTVLVQPENKETAAGILFGLLHIAKRHPNSIVTILPSDHFVLEEDRLAGYLKYAQLLVRRDPSRLVLLGIEPDREESEYGYIVPDRSRKRSANPVLQISSFVEKPHCEMAQQLTRTGALWNTMMMVFKTDTLLNLMKRLTPALFDAFGAVYQAIGTSAEDAVTQETYRRLPPINFSKEILEPVARDRCAKLIAVPVRHVLWSDWGSESRIMEVLRNTGNASRLNGLTRASDFAAENNCEQDFIRPSQRTSRQRGKSRTQQPIAGLISGSVA